MEWLFNILNLKPGSQRILLCEIVDHKINFARNKSRLRHDTERTHNI